jgi:hypothetical protein
VSSVSPDTFGENDTLDKLTRDALDGDSPVALVAWMLRRTELKWAHTPPTKVRPPSSRREEWSDLGDLFISDGPETPWTRIEVSRMNRWSGTPKPEYPTIIVAGHHRIPEAEPGVAARPPGERYYILSGDARHFARIDADAHPRFQLVEMEARSRTRRAWVCPVQFVSAWGTFDPDMYRQLIVDVAHIADSGLQGGLL